MTFVTQFLAVSNSMLPFSLHVCPSYTRFILIAIMILDRQNEHLMNNICNLFRKHGMKSEEKMKSGRPAQSEKKETRHWEREERRGRTEKERERERGWGRERDEKERGGWEREREEKEREGGWGREKRERKEKETEGGGGGRQTDRKTDRQRQRNQPMNQIKTHKRLKRTLFNQD